MKHSMTSNVSFLAFRCENTRYYECSALLIANWANDISWTQPKTKKKSNLLWKNHWECLDYNENSHIIFFPKILLKLNSNIYHLFILFSCDVHHYFHQTEIQCEDEEVFFPSLSDFTVNKFRKKRKKREWRIRGQQRREKRNNNSNYIIFTIHKSHCYIYNILLAEKVFPQDHAEKKWIVNHEEIEFPLYCSNSHLLF